uniref:Uncharacterized protein n=1 Tax=Opuntia streptacantha TaxID=393608 RepID=A0A7C8Z813_OPUST
MFNHLLCDLIPGPFESEFFSLSPTRIESKKHRSRKFRVWFGVGRFKLGPTEAVLGICIQFNIRLFDVVSQAWTGFCCIWVPQTLISTACVPEVTCRIQAFEGALLQRESEV